MELLRKRLGLIFRSLVSILLIAWLVRNIQWHKVWANVLVMDVHWLLAGFILFVPVILVVAWRWRLLLSVHGVRLPYWRTIELTMIGQLFSAVGVGTTGGDVVKIFYVARAVPERKAAVAFSVIVDRIIGLAALLFFGVVLSVTQLPLLFSQPSAKFFTMVFYLFALGALVASIGACFGPALMERPAIRALILRLPLMNKGASLLTAYDRTARAYGVNLIAFLGSLPSHLCSTLMAYCVLRAMHLQLPLLPAFSIIVIVNMLIALPVSIAGIGFREKLFVLFFGLLGLDPEHAVTFSLTFYFLNLLWSLASGPFYFLYRHETHTPAPDVSPVDPIYSQP